MADRDPVTGSEETVRQRAQLLAEFGRRLYQAGHLPATSGNLSVRLDHESLLITRAGSDKSSLEARDFVVVDLFGVPRGSGRPSGETPVHAVLYRHSPQVGAVFHAHPASAVVLSLWTRGATEIVLQGYELQKAIRGVTQAKERLILPILENDEDVLRLSTNVGRVLTHSQGTATFGVVVRSHGVYIWGENVGETWRHFEALEALIRYEIERRRVEGVFRGRLPEATANLRSRSAIQLGQIDHVNIVVEDLDRMVRFYSEVLDLKEFRRSALQGDWVDRVVGLSGVEADVAFLESRNGTNLELIQYRRPQGGRWPDRAQANLHGLRHLAFQVEDIFGAVEAWQLCGVEFLSDVEEVPVTQMSLGDTRRKRLVYLKDPEGNLLEICSYQP
jgi:methylthioribulose-1-phosphate dehydratase